MELHLHKNLVWLFKNTKKQTKKTIAVASKKCVEPNAEEWESGSAQRVTSPMKEAKRIKFYIIMINRRV